MRRRMEIKTTGEIWKENTGSKKYNFDHWERPGRETTLFFFESNEPEKQWLSLNDLKQLLTEGIQPRQEGFCKSKLNLFDEGYYRALTHIQLKIEETLQK